MFVSHDKNNKKKSQKPNILRRKPKSVLKTVSKEFGDQNYRKSNNEKNILKCNTSKEQCEEGALFVRNMENETDVCLFSVADMDEELVDQSINIDSFLVENSINQNKPVHASVKQSLESPPSELHDKLYFKFVDDDYSTLIIEECEDEDNFSIEKSDINTMVPLSIVTTDTQDNSELQEASLIDFVDNKVSVEDLTQYSQYFIRYKCDEPNCNKDFPSEEKLTKHKNTHKKVSRVVRQSALECPVKKIDFTGTEVNCERIFQVKADLIKHLNEDHTPNDAAFGCDECERRFFYASGLRAHGRAHAAHASRVSFACTWPGCARVFRHPCRLREHSRAHTGAKPYHCTFPECGWSFRTASKLLRHSRRHTGDRRHPCAHCGRAFLRREHLRDHLARQHNTNDKIRSSQTKKSDSKEPKSHKVDTTVGSNQIPKVEVKTESMPKETSLQSIENNSADVIVESKHEERYMVELWDGATLELLNEKKGDLEDAVVGSPGGGEGAGGGEGQSARTHCTWPLHAQQHYVMEDDVQVEQLEGSESNIFTVRSDLFLHGSVFHNEDSEQMCSSERVLDPELTLDAPSVHLAQEELYTDAVDESSFRVFLLSGEELS